MKASNWNTSCGCVRWTEPTPSVLDGGRSIDLPFVLDTHGMPGKLHKELMVELDDAVGVHSCPVECKVIAPSNLPVVLKLGPVPEGKRRIIDLDVGPGPSGAAVRLRGVRPMASALRWVKTTPKLFPSGSGASVQLALTPPAGSASVVQLEVRIDFELPAQVTQNVKIEYEKPAS